MNERMVEARARLTGLLARVEDLADGIRELRYEDELRHMIEVRADDAEEVYVLLEDIIDDMEVPASGVFAAQGGVLG